MVHLGNLGFIQSGPCVGRILFCVGLSAAEHQTQDVGGKNLHRVKKIFWSNVMLET